MGPQPHPLLHFLVRMKPTSTNVFFSGRQKCESHNVKYLGCKEDVEVFLSQISDAHPLPDWQYGYRPKEWISPTAFQGVLTLWRVSAPSATKTNHTSLLFFVCLHFQCWTNTPLHYAHIQSNKETTVCTREFYYACLLVYRWQYRYVITLLPVFARNVFIAGIRLSFDILYRV